MRLARAKTGRRCEFSNYGNMFIKIVVLIIRNVLDFNEHVTQLF